MSEEDKKSIAKTVDAFFTDEIMELVRRSYTKPYTMDDLMSGEDSSFFRTDDAFRAYTKFNLNLYAYLDSEKAIDKYILFDAIWEKYQYLHALLRLDDRNW
jgi:hypothetical protein